MTAQSCMRAWFGVTPNPLYKEVAFFFFSVAFFFPNGWPSRIFNDCRKNTHRPSHHSYFRNLSDVKLLSQSSDVWLYHEYATQHIFSLVLNLHPLRGWKYIWNVWVSIGFRPMAPFVPLYLSRWILTPLWNSVDLKKQSWQSLGHGRGFRVCPQEFNDIYNTQRFLYYLKLELNLYWPLVWRDWCKR